MASVIQLPSAPNSGLSALASVLLGGATDYANQRRADTVEGRRREQRLADIESERAYSDKNYTRSRNDRLADVSSEREYVDERYELQREDKISDVRDARYWEQKIRNQGAEEAQQRLDQLTEDEAGVTGRMDARQRRLSAPEPQPTREQVMARALAIARATSGKPTPPTAEIEAAIPQAIEEARTVLNQSWQRERLDAQEEQRIDALRLQRIGADKNTITNIFRRVGLAQVTVPQPPAAAPSTSPRPDLASVQQQFAEQLRAQLQNKEQPAPAPAVSAPGTNPDYTYQGGLLGGIERAGPVAKSALSRLAEVPTNIDRAAGALGAGLLTGDFSDPKQGGMGMIGSSIGNWFSDAIAESQRNVENTILTTQPNSERAREIRMRRGRSGDPVPVIGIPTPTLYIPSPRKGRPGLSTLSDVFPVN
jgi:hypothetical protein